MKTLYIECNMGAAGDMLMAALSELLPDPEGFVARMNALNLPGVRFERRKTEKCGITGTHMAVTVDGVEEQSEDTGNGNGGHGHIHDEDDVRPHAAYGKERFPVFVPRLHQLRNVPEGVSDESQSGGDLVRRRVGRHRVCGEVRRDELHRMRGVLVQLSRIPRHNAELPPRKGVHPHKNRQRKGRGRRRVREEELIR